MSALIETKIFSTSISLEELDLKFICLLATSLLTQAFPDPISMKIACT